MSRKSQRVFEWLLIATLIGIVLVFALGLYGRMAGDVQRLSFELAAQNFKTAVSGVRAHWFIQRAQGETERDVVVFSELPTMPVGLEDASDIRVYLNPQGWPVNTRSRREAADGRLDPEECLDLWRAFLHQAPPVSLEGALAPNAVFGVAKVGEGRESACRYRQLVGDSGRRYFDYLPFDGRVLLSSSLE
ncbi:MULTISPECIES: hypothetical protein [unclassified Marinimicrobium]|jgi:hypothetical protein|uniref:hypothetical protein n=1 Tax=Marinimicrobium TaxID=359337 RepID=UPI00257ACF03|nr:MULTISPECIES: hypothetical protein [unclassified Marinimicrobium]|tara:strand:- start:726 stop:1295 length:570 start_codon:yes stop_codon:yes gene_type:complete